jgi:hypothetical protein
MTEKTLGKEEKFVICNIFVSLLFLFLASSSSSTLSLEFAENFLLF